MYEVKYFCWTRKKCVAFDADNMIVCIATITEKYHPKSKMQVENIDRT